MSYMRTEVAIGACQVYCSKSAGLPRRLRPHSGRCASQPPLPPTPFSREARLAGAATVATGKSAASPPSFIYYFGQVYIYGLTSHTRRTPGHHLIDALARRRTRPDSRDALMEPWQSRRDFISRLSGGRWASGLAPKQLKFLGTKRADATLFTHRRAARKAMRIFDGAPGGGKSPPTPRCARYSHGPPLRVGARRRCLRCLSPHAAALAAAAPAHDIDFGRAAGRAYSSPPRRHAAKERAKVTRARRQRADMMRRKRRRRR